MHSDSIICKGVHYTKIYALLRCGFMLLVTSILPYLRRAVKWIIYVKGGHMLSELSEGFIKCCLKGRM